MPKKRVFSGTRPTGKLHLGNYLGAVKGYLALQERAEYECLYMVMDLHAITTPYEKTKLASMTKEIVLSYLAAGLDPKKAIITAQSLVPEHVYLAYLFSSVINVARLQHLPTFKDKVKQYPKHVTLALLAYPVLMAADILLYKAELVPAGLDQEPHLEIAREIARKMNLEYGTDFPLVKRFVTTTEAVPSLLGEGKMSKSKEGSYINLTDSLAVIKQKLAAVPTDSGQGNFLPKSGNLVNLLTLVEIFEGKAKRKFYENEYLGKGIGYAQLKTELAYAIYERLKPIQENYQALLARPRYVEEVMKTGASQARILAKETLKEVKEKMGFLEFFKAFGL